LFFSCLVVFIFLFSRFYVHFPISHYLFLEGE
jgi:hypothetical protein